MRGQQGVLALAIAVAFLAAPGLAIAGDDGPAPTQSGILNVGMPDLMKARNLLSSVAQDDPYTTAVLARVYDTAVQRNATTGAVVSRLAVGEDANGNGALDPAEIGVFDVSPTSPTVTVFYNFTNGRFHEGIPVTVMDIVFSYHLLALQPQMNGPLWVLMDQGGGAGSNFSTTRWLWVVPVDDGDGNPATAALRFSPQFPYAGFPFATLGIPIFPRHEFEGTGMGRHPIMASPPGCNDPDWGLTIYPEADPRAGQGVPVTETTYRPFRFDCAQAWPMVDADVIGSGHFKFGTWVFGALASLDANPDYAFGRPKVDRVVFKVYRTTQLGVFALMNGEIDFLYWSLPSEFLPDLQNDPNINVVSAPGLLPYSMVFNMRRVPFGYNAYPPADRTNDVGYPFRQAMQHLVDKDTIVRVLLQGYGDVADGVISPTNDGWHNTSLPAYAYDPTLAAQVLDNAGWTDTNGNGWREFPRLGDSQFQLVTPQADYDPIMASAGAMIASAARSIGINMVTWPNSIAAMIPMLGARDFEVAIMGVADVHPSDPWTLMRGDPDYLADQFHSRNSAAGRNLGGLSDGPFDSIVTLSRHEINPVARTSDVKAAEGILADRGPVIPMYYRTSNWAYRSDRFTGWHLIASTIFNYWSLQDLDSTMNVSPQIVLMSPTSGSLIRPGTPIDLDVRDTDLVSVEYSVDGVPPSVLPAPYDLSTDSWADGNHLIAVRATDPYTETIAYYPFRVDGTPPRVLAVSPTNGSVVPAGRISLKVTFSEAVNRTSVEAGFSLFVGSTRWGARDGTFAWAANSTSFRFNTTQAVPESATLEVRLTENLTDTVGNPMGTEYAWQFTTPQPPLAVAAVFAGIAAVGIAAVLIVLLVAMRLRKKRPLNPQP